MSNDYVSIELHKDDDEIHLAIVGNPAFTSEGKIYLNVNNADDLEDLEAEIESLAFAIREFRMKNFPESDTIE